MRGEEEKGETERARGESKVNLGRNGRRLNARRITFNPIKTGARTLFCLNGSFIGSLDAFLSLWTLFCLLGRIDIFSCLFKRLFCFFRCFFVCYNVFCLSGRISIFFVSLDAFLSLWTLICLFGRFFSCFDALLSLWTLFCLFGCFFVSLDTFFVSLPSFHYRIVVTVLFSFLLPSLLPCFKQSRLLSVINGRLTIVVLGSSLAAITW